MKKATTYLIEEETIKKISFLAEEKKKNYSDYLTSLVERDWMENISTLPFAEMIVADVKKNGNTKKKN